MKLAHVFTILYGAAVAVASLYIDPLKVGTAVAFIGTAASFLAKATKDGTVLDSFLVGISINPSNENTK